MIRLILSLMLIFSATLLSEYMLARMRKRKAILDLFLSRFRRAEEALTFTEDDLCRLFFSEDPPDGISFEEKWKKLVENEAVLKREEKRFLIEYAALAGRSDQQSELKLLAHFSRETEKRIEKIETDLREKTRVYRVSGFGCGMALSLMLM